MAQGTLPPPAVVRAPARARPFDFAGRSTWIGLGLLAPAALVALLFSLIPLLYLVQVSLTEGAATAREEQ